MMHAELLLLKELLFSSMSYKNEKMHLLIFSLLFYFYLIVRSMYLKHRLTASPSIQPQNLFFFGIRKKCCQFAAIETFVTLAKSLFSKARKLSFAEELLMTLVSARFTKHTGGTQERDSLDNRQSKQVSSVRSITAANKWAADTRFLQERQTARWCIWESVY